MADKKFKRFEKRFIPNKMGGMDTVMVPRDLTLEEKIVESIEKETKLPGNVQKLMNFMDETGGDLKDYVNLNRDYSEMDNQTLLKEYYKKTKPHLKPDEIDFLMEDQFSFDEESDEERDIKRKKTSVKRASCQR